MAVSVRTSEKRRGPLKGVFAVPGDKSISHRAVLLAAMAHGESTLSGVLESQDVRSTVGVVEALGARVALSPSTPPGTLAGTVTGWAASGPDRPAQPLDCGNSGTTARLLMGVLAGSGVEATIVGDASLEARPMRRVVDPLTRMGGHLEATAAGTLPVTVHPSRPLIAGAYELPVASAQVKSAILLAGLSAQGVTSVTEPSPSRDHTERMLPLFGVDVSRIGTTCSVEGPAALGATEVFVPGDPSSAAFIAVAAALIEGSDVTVQGVSLNPTRIGFVEAMRSMGADVETIEKGGSSEPWGDIRIRHDARLTGCVVEPALVPSLIDEIPILALLATAASGPTRFRDVAELRVKESDRLAAIVAGIRALGGEAREEGDDLVVEGRPITRGVTLDPLGDHRLAMTWGVAGMLIDGVGVIEPGCVDVSFPGFFDTVCGPALRSDRG